MNTKTSAPAFKAVRSNIIPTVEIDAQSGSSYVRFAARFSRVTRTVSISDWPLINVDLNKDGLVMGVESIGHRELTISELLRKAGVEADAEAVARARYVLVTEKDVVLAQAHTRAMKPRKARPDLVEVRAWQVDRRKVRTSRAIASR